MPPAFESYTCWVGPVYIHTVKLVCPRQLRLLVKRPSSIDCYSLFQLYDSHTSSTGVKQRKPSMKYNLGLLVFLVSHWPQETDRSPLGLGFQLSLVRSAVLWTQSHNRRRTWIHLENMDQTSGLPCLFSYTCSQPSSNLPCNQGLKDSNEVFSGFDWLTACVGEVGSPPLYLGFASVPQEVILYFFDRFQFVQACISTYHTSTSIPPQF